MELFVHGLFTEEKAAARAVESLIDAHFEPDKVCALMRGEGHLKEALPSYTAPVVHGALIGAAFGVVGAGLAVSGGFLVAGSLATVVGGGATGFLGGAVSGLGRWRNEIEFPRLPSGPGMILVGVSTGRRSIDRAEVAIAGAQPQRIHISSKREACVEVETGTLSDAGTVHSPTGELIVGTT